jgi:TRAP-type C4-dicarboxylate transport system permease small subunit
VPGGFEIVQYLMAIVVFAALPLTTAADKHLSVSLITDQLRGVARYLHRIFVLLVSTVAVVLIAWRMAVQASLLSSSQQVSGFLQWQLAPVAWTMTALAALAAFIILVKLATALTGREVESIAPAGPGPD